MRRWFGWAAAAVLVGLLLVAWPWIRPAFSGGVKAAALLLERAGGWGPLVVVGLQTLQAVISPLPSWPITVAAGAAYGPWMGTVYSLVGGTAGAAINFGLARRLGHPLIRRTLGAKWIDRAARLGAFHFLVLSLLGRLIPIASFDAVAYVAGISGVGLAAFLVVAVIGQAPALFAYAFFGSDLSSAQSAGLWGSMVVLLLVLAIVAGRTVWNRMFQD